MKQRFLTALLSVVLLMSLFPWTMSVSAAADTDIPADATVCGGNSYKVYTMKKTWTEAKEYCERRGGHLVTLTNSSEQWIVAKLVRDAGVASWIGGYREGKSFYWVTGENFSYAQWADGEPSGTIGSESEYYLGIYASDTDSKFAMEGKWNDFRNSTETVGGFVCEWEAECVSEAGRYPQHTAAPHAVTKAPTCTEEGLLQSLCKSCGKVLEESKISSTGHTESPAVTHREATCTEDGLRTVSCETCAAVLSEESIPALGHRYGEWQEIAGSVLIPPIVKEHRCVSCDFSELREDWSYVWVPILAGIGAVALVLGLVNYFRAFKKR